MSWMWTYIPKPFMCVSSLSEKEGKSDCYTFYKSAKKILLCDMCISFRHFLKLVKNVAYNIFIKDCYELWKKILSTLFLL